MTRLRRPSGARAAVSPTLPPLGLAVLLVATAALLFHETRGTTLWFDEWQWALDRRGGGVDTFLRPHNEHLSLVPVALYKLLFATAGLEHSAPYRALLIAAHLACVVLLFAYARRRVGEPGALAAAALVLTLGPAWQNLLWPFQVGSLVSLAAGMGALLMLDRRDRAGDAAACGLLGLSLASSGLGLPIAAGVVVEIAWGRRGSRAAWIVAAPLALYAAWWLAYQDAGFVRHNVVLAPGFAADAAAAAVSALVGLAGPGEQTLGWGRPLAVALGAALVWRLGKMRPVPPRVLGLLAVALSFWLLTGLRRAGISSPQESRYLYVGAVLIVLLTVELAQGTRLHRPALLAVAVAIAVVANLGDLRDAGRSLRDQAQLTRASLGAVELARRAVEPDHVVQLPGYPLLIVRAGAYLAAADALGSPAAAPAGIARLSEPARAAADAELVRIHRLAPRSGAGGRRSATGPTVDAAAGGAVSRRGGCVRFGPAAAGPAAVAPTLELTVPPAGILLHTRDGPATVTLRRFAGAFPAQPHGRMRAAAVATLRTPRDSASAPWRVRVATRNSLVACASS